jgi:hypothetical protein
LAWYCDPPDEASGSVFVLIGREAGFRGNPRTESLTPGTWRDRAAFVPVPDDEVHDLEALWAFR